MIKKVYHALDEGKKQITLTYPSQGEQVILDIIHFANGKLIWDKKFFFSSKLLIRLYKTGRQPLR